jgi:hypothetical protein
MSVTEHEVPTSSTEPGPSRTVEELSTVWNALADVGEFGSSDCSIASTTTWWTSTKKTAGWTTTSD